jgi:hypothetical protein
MDAKGKARQDFEVVGLERADPAPDSGELSESEASDPALDSPGDEGLLEQEEQYEGISSERAPSERQGRAAPPEGPDRE